MTFVSTKQTSLLFPRLSVCMHTTVRRPIVTGPTASRPKGGCTWKEARAHYAKLSVVY